MSADTTPGKKDVKVINGESYLVLDTSNVEQIDKTFFGQGWNYIIDFAASPTLKQAYTGFSSTIVSEMNEKQIVREAVIAICDLFTDREDNHVWMLLYKLKQKSTQLSLEDFAESRTGNCTHVTFTTLLFLEKLKHEQRLSGTWAVGEAAWQGEFSGGAHMWGKFIPDHQKPIIFDATVGEGFVGSQEEYQPVLKQIENHALFDF